MLNFHEERVDLQMHTVYSTMDGLIEVRELFITADIDQWPTVVVTDTNTAQAFPEMKKCADRYGIKPIYGAQLLCGKEDSADAYPITVLVRNQGGIKNLYTLISMSNARNGHLPLTEVLKYREGLLLGTGGADGLLTAVLLNNEDYAESMAKAFDFLEIQPLDYYQYKWKDHFAVRQSVEAHIRRLSELGKQFDIPLAATSGARYLRDESALAYKVLRYSVDAVNDDIPSFHYRNTKEMLEEFSFLGETETQRAVIDNPLRITGQIEDNITPISEGSHFIRFDNAEAEIHAAAYQKATELYGAPLPKQISERLSREMDAIVKSESASMFVLCSKITEKAKESNYEVMQRGCTAASFVAYLLGITNVNPLPAHYRCACHYTEFPGLQYYTGYDLPEKRCPICGKFLARSGMNLVPETLFGLNGEKKPNFEISVASEYRETIRQQLTDIFGTAHVVRTTGWDCIGTDDAEKMLAAYLEKHPLPMAEEERPELTDRIAEAKSGDTLYPDVLFLIPKGNEITDFSPLVLLDDDPATQFDAFKLDTILTKIDIIDDSKLSTLHTLSEAAGAKTEKIDIDSLSAANMINKEKTMCLPYFEEDRVQSMMKELKIAGISDLLKVFGFAHGTGTWEAYEDCQSSASDKALVNHVAFRDDVFNDLVMHGVDRQKAFEIMELVRRGQFYQGSDAWNYPNRDRKQSEMESLLKTSGFSEKYIRSLKKIKYLFPKAHAAECLDIAMKIVWLMNDQSETSKSLNDNPVY